MRSFEERKQEIRRRSDARLLAIKHTRQCIAGVAAMCMALGISVAVMLSMPDEPPAIQREEQLPTTSISALDTTTREGECSTTAASSTATRETASLSIAPSSALIRTTKTPPRGNGTTEPSVIVTVSQTLPVSSTASAPPTYTTVVTTTRRPTVTISKISTTTATKDDWWNTGGTPPGSPNIPPQTTTVTTPTTDADMGLDGVWLTTTTTTTTVTTVVTTGYTYQ